MVSNLDTKEKILIQRERGTCSNGLHRGGWKLQHLSHLGYIYSVLSTTLFAKYVGSGWGWNAHGVTCFWATWKWYFKTKRASSPRSLSRHNRISVPLSSNSASWPAIVYLLKPFHEFEPLTQWLGGAVGPRTLEVGSSGDHYPDLLLSHKSDAPQ